MAQDQVLKLILVDEGGNAAPQYYDTDGNPQPLTGTAAPSQEIINPNGEVIFTQSIPGYVQDTQLAQYTSAIRDALTQSADGTTPLTTTAGTATPKNTQGNYYLSETLEAGTEQDVLDITAPIELFAFQCMFHSREQVDLQIFPYLEDGSLSDQPILRSVRMGRTNELSVGFLSDFPHSHWTVANDGDPDGNTFRFILNQPVRFQSGVRMVASNNTDVTEHVEILAEYNDL